MKNIIYIAAFVITGALFFSSCDDFLEAENKSAGGTLAEDYYSTDAGLQTFLGIGLCRVETHGYQCRDQ